MEKVFEALKIGIPKLKKLYENSAKKMSKNDILGFDLTFIYLDKVVTSLKLIKTKSKKNYNLALVVDSGTYEQYCEQFKYFLDDYNEKGGAFEIWEEDRFSLEEYILLREVFVYE